MAPKSALHTRSTASAREEGAAVDGGLPVSALESSAVPGVTPPAAAANPCPAHGDLSKIPPGFSCAIAVDPRAADTSVFFDQNSAALSPAARGTIDTVAAVWTAGGAAGVLRVDGYASQEGPDGVNWNLSCVRATAVAAELQAPSDGSPGVPASNIVFFAHGETTEFSCTNLPPNRRAVITTPAGIPAPTCTIASRTIDPAPDGTPATRTTVGVNEEVELTSSVPAVFTASAGAITPASPTVSHWTAPDTPGASHITATPASGGGCGVDMTVIQPAFRAQTAPAPQAYTAGLAGSGFVATVTIHPLNVSFHQTQVREETVASFATGYYDTVLGWNGIMHPQTASWLNLDVNNSGLIDTVGTVPPGTGGPFSFGTFIWPIPQSYRTATGATVYSTGVHVQVMGGTSGVEATAKEGAINSRTP